MFVQESHLQDPWKQFANCLGVDPDLFFPERGASTKEAKRVCSACVVRQDCLEYALAHHISHGVWGGSSERQRRRLQHQRQQERMKRAVTERPAAVA